MTPHRATGILVIALLLGGCTVGPDYHPPNFVAPSQWEEQPGQAGTEAHDFSWWESFDDPILDQLIHSAIVNNRDLKIAGERVIEARDELRVAASDNYPIISIGGAAENRRQSQTLEWPPPASAGDYRYYQFGFDASWELDLFGGTRRREEAARAGVGQAVEAERGILISLMAEVASDYGAYRAVQARLQVAQASLTTAQETQHLAAHAFDAGERPQLDLLQAQAEVDAAQTAIPPLRAQSDDLLHALAILLGRLPEQFGSQDLGPKTGIPTPPALPLSLPSDVIAQRPDIREAERSYAQANAEIGVAVANLYPHVAIPLDLGLNTSTLHQAFTIASLAWTAGVTGGQTLYSGGRRSAKIDAARARTDAARLAYEQTVLKAFQEVEDALADETAAQQRDSAIVAEADEDRQALNEALRRYRQGETGFLPVLETRQQFYAAQDAAAQSALTRLLSAIVLYKALGGGWIGVALPNASEFTSAPASANAVK